MMVFLFPPESKGGAEMQCLKQAKALVARGHAVTILTRWLRFRTPRNEIMDGVSIRRYGFFLPMTMCLRDLHDGLVAVLPMRNKRLYRNWAEVPVSQGGPKKRFRWMAPVEWLGNMSFILETAMGTKGGRIQADVVHVHESHWLAGFAQWVGEKISAPVFCKEALANVLSWPVTRDVPWLAQWKRRREQCRWIAITPGIREDLLKTGISEDRIVDIPNGVELPEKAASPETHDEAVYAGNFTQGAGFKAFDILLQAWGKACREEPQMKLRLFGAGEIERWERFAEKEGCGNTVEFAGRTDHLDKEFQSSGFLVLPSRSEGLSNVLLEAMASGLPAVVSDIPGNVVAIRDGLDGMVVPAGDADALAEAMVRMARNPEMRARMGRSARMRVQEVFSIEKVAEKLEQAYSLALSGPAPMRMDR